MIGFIDTNIYLSRWPLRRLPLDRPNTLADTLREMGVVEAWCGSFDSLLHKDIAAANQRLATACNKQPLFKPFGSVNLTLPEWEEDLRRCVEEHHMPGIRIHPNYHGYTLEDARFERLLALAAERRFLLQLTVQMEDERMMHPRLRVPPVDLSPLPPLLKKIPAARIILLNSLKGSPDAIQRACADAGNAWFDLAMVEGLGGLSKVLEALPVNRLLYGSHAPLFYPQAAHLKLKESELDKAQSTAIQHENAQHLHIQPA